MAIWAQIIQTALQSLAAARAIILRDSFRHDRSRLRRASLFTDMNRRSFCFEALFRDPEETLAGLKLLFDPATLQQIGSYTWPMRQCASLHPPGTAKVLHQLAFAMVRYQVHFFSGDHYIAYMCSPDLGEIHECFKSPGRAR
jgi:hypothetical protein